MIFARLFVSSALVGVAFFSQTLPQQAPVKPPPQSTPVAGYSHGLGRDCQATGPEADSHLSYRVSDLGKPGVPVLDTQELQEIKSITRYVPRSTLWFVMLGYGKGAPAFSIFQDFSCQAMPQVLNNPPCNSIFDIPEGQLSVAPDCYGMIARPWMPGDYKDRAMTGIVDDPKAWRSVHR